MTLWEKGYSPHQLVESYTVGKDPILDLKLLPFDCDASIAHAAMLHDIGLLTEKEYEQLEYELETIKHQALSGNFTIMPDQEDGHTAIEEALIEKLGDLGKKIHTARSRNDQVLTALRLFVLKELKGIGQKMKELVSTLSEFKSRYDDIEIPGYSHTRKAMPTTVGAWVGSMIASVQDNLDHLDHVVELQNKSPLGTGAGYGIPMKLNRELTAFKLGFRKVLQNPIYAQHSRPKFDALTLGLCTFIMADLNTYASDLIWYSSPELGYFSLPDELTTGSSIMPQKKNPDVLELIRAHYHAVLSKEIQVKTQSSNLVSGYHRDFQLLKEPLMESLDMVRKSLDVFNLVFQKLACRKEACSAAMTDDLFATEKVYQLVQKGIPFRDAYRQVAEQFHDS